MENKRKHLELIQDVITRMAGNLFFLRGWAITLVAALLALFVKEENHNYIFILYFLVVIFWILDGYFLSQERLFRALYNHVRKLNEKKVDFSMSTTDFQKEFKNGWLGSMFSITLLFFYVPLIIMILSVLYFIK